jgi:hypothetical protein
MAFPDTFISTLAELATQWGCPLVTNPAKTKFLFRSNEMPTRCIVFKDSMSPARSWERGEFGDTVMMRWERFLGKITESVDFEAILRDAYLYGPPFYGIAEVDGSPGLFMVDFQELSWALSDDQLAEELTARYGMGLLAEPIRGVELQFDAFNSLFVFQT